MIKRRRNISETWQLHILAVIIVGPDIALRDLSDTIGIFGFIRMIIAYLIAYSITWIGFKIVDGVKKLLN
ncbi:hypothetical protein [Flammeovirga aprica]|uniref:Uncharacterized protein n=1 Tax=Flammeovirga aprica JL-4 TaxID=694437 RepID=A0A7X9RXI8_9BACT|nr:hypothetical protein [Flammeovirga aprica]NME70576.1 hypothetical protein [Flammeovirga aprica JL-4]